MSAASPSCLQRTLRRTRGGPRLSPPGLAFGAGQELARSPAAAFRLSISAGEGTGDHQVLQVPGEARRLGVGAELCDHRAQQPLVQATLYRQRQLCSYVSANLGPLLPLQGPWSPRVRSWRAPPASARLRSPGDSWGLLGTPVLTRVLPVLGGGSLSTFIFMKRLPSLHSRERFKSFSIHSPYLISTLSFKRTLH